MGHPLVDQACFLHTRNHINRVAQKGAAACQKFLAIACFAQGLRGHGPDMLAGKACQSFREPCEACPSTLHGFLRQIAVFIQSVALANGFLEVFHTLYVTVLEAANFQAKAVGSKIHSGEQCSVLHGVAQCAKSLWR